MSFEYVIRFNINCCICLFVRDHVLSTYCVKYQKSQQPAPVFVFVVTYTFECEGKSGTADLD